MGLLRSRKRDDPQPVPIAEEPDPVDVVPETVLSAALQALCDQVQREGIAAVSARLESDPALLPGLARCVVEVRQSTARALWQNSADPLSGAHSYEAAMDAMGLGWCAFPPRPLPAGIGLLPDGGPGFRILASYQHPSGVRLPAVIAPVRDRAADTVGGVVLFLKPDWSGATDLKPAFVTVGEVIGSCIALRQAGRALAACVTFATAARVHTIDHELPVWLTITRENLAEHFAPPDTLRVLYIAYEDDEREAAYAAARRISQTTVGLRIAFLPPGPERVEEFLPDDPLYDAVAD